MKKIIFILPVLFLLCSCSSTVSVIENFKDQKADSQKYENSKIVLLGPRFIISTEQSFTKLIINNYPDTSKLRTKICEFLKKEAIRERASFEITEGNTKVLPEMHDSTYTNTKDKNKADEFFRNIHEDFLLIIWTIKIDSVSSTGYSSGYWMGNSFMSGGLYTKKVNPLTLEAQLWNVKEQKKIFSILTEDSTEGYPDDNIKGVESGIKYAARKIVAYIVRNCNPTFSLPIDQDDLRNMY